ncbi:MAG TPA: hypothetical protein VJX73_15455 [Terracidiphilus sp.]|nr:hypothetical protein [Terracidiphilus sp.]
MNVLTNIWNQPKTSAAGLLIAVASIAGVLSQQGVTLGKAGTGTVVTLASALATALLGLLAKDPKAGSEGAGEQGSTAKLGAWMLIALILSATLPATGCTASASELQSDATALASALNNLAVVIQPSDATAASNLRTAAAALAAAAQSPTTGPAWELALNAATSGAEVVLSAIPVTAPYAALLAIAVAAAEAIIANTASDRASVKAETTGNNANLLWYTRTGRGLIRHRFGRGPAGDFKASWNAEAAATGFAGAAVQ